LFDELFELFDEKLSDHLDFVPLDPFYRFHFADGSQFDYRASVEDTLTEIRRFNPDDADGYLKLLDKSKKVYDVGFKQLDGIWSNRCRPCSFSNAIKQFRKWLIAISNTH